MADYLDERQRAMLAEMGLGIWQLTPSLLPSAQMPVPADAQRAAVAPTAQGDGERAKSAARVPPPAAAAPPPPKAQGEWVAAASLADLIPLNWEQLEQRAANCNDCGLCASRQTSIWGYWPGMGTQAGEQGSPPQAKILVLTDPPDEADEVSGLPLGGEQSAAGSLLQAMLNAAAWVPNGAAGGVFVTPVTKCKVPAGYKLGPDELRACRRYVAQQIALLQPQLILTLGRVAAQTLLSPLPSQGPAQALGQLRGTVHEVQGHAMVASLAPQYLLRNPLEKAKAWEDLCLALAHLSSQPS